jgi:hypothetical protein
MAKARTRRATSKAVTAVGVSLLLPGVAQAHDGRIIVLWFAFSTLFMGVLGALAIAVFAVARRRAHRLVRASALRRAVAGGLLGFPVGAGALYLCVFVGMASTGNHPGERAVLFVMAGALLLQLGYVVLICRWMGRARVAARFTPNDRAA